MKFWDTSALVPLFIEEALTHSLHLLLQNDQSMALWWGTKLEAASALARGVRNGFLNNSDVKIALTSLDELTAAAILVEPTSTILDRAQRLLFSHNLRSADALQLAAALTVCQEQSKGFGFVTVDKRLAAAATREGFFVYPEGTF